MTADRPQETAIPADKVDPGMQATDDHVAGPRPAPGQQRTDDLDEGVGREHLSSASQGVRPEPQGGSPGSGEEAVGSAGEAVGGGPSGAESDAGEAAGPMFEEQT